MRLRCCRIHLSYLYLIWHSSSASDLNEAKKKTRDRDKAEFMWSISSVRWKFWFVIRIRLWNINVVIAHFDLPNAWLYSESQPNQNFLLPLPLIYMRPRWVLSNLYGSFTPNNLLPNNRSDTAKLGCGTHCFQYPSAIPIGLSRANQYKNYLVWTKRYGSFTPKLNLQPTGFRLAPDW